MIPLGFWIWRKWPDPFVFTQNGLCCFTWHCAAHMYPLRGHQGAGANPSRHRMRAGLPWTSHQFIIGLTWDKQTFTLTFTPTGNSEAVHIARVFTSNKTLLLRFTLPFTWQWRACTPETANIWNWVPEWNLFKTTTSFPAVWTGKWSACKRDDDTNANANASTSQCIPL